VADRVDRVFGRLRAYAVARLPWLRGIKIRHCRECDESHRKKWRQFAHAAHYPMTVCFAADAERELTDLELLGMGAHEIGHVIGDKIGLPRHRGSSGAGKTPLAVQDEADKAVLHMLGLVIRYNERTLQELVEPPEELLR
jgi:hypothetical protein